MQTTLNDPVVSLVDSGLHVIPDPEPGRHDGVVNAVARIL
jgi:hypothetical protein